jgi:D-cysteine desulfhydrase
MLRDAFEKARAAGRQPSLIPYGGSSPIGAAAYAEAIAELLAQGVPIDRIVFATSSGGTQAGMVAGARLHGFRGRITGISVDEKAEVLRQRVAALAVGVAEVLGRREVFDPGEIEVDDRFTG